jgi:hypothetical protein
MLPVLHWLRVICASTAPQGPPLRAGFMFDDPNLHWPTYGHVDFAEMARHAKREHYHVSFATIPLDTWFTHKAAARIFADNPEQLSLLIHGNNHINSEMGREYTAEARAALMAQAIRRIERFERRTSLPVSRVMVAPGGICWEDMIAVLPEQGYEAACISHGSLRAHNKAKPWTKQLGLLPSEIIRGCPVLPRWALSNDLTNTILLAAYLNQAIILRGHQQDVKAGLEILDEAARFINSLGPVQWSDMTSLARRNYQWRQEGKVLRLLPLGRKLSIPVPEGAEELLIESPPEAGWERWQVRLTDGARLEVRAGDRLTLPTGQTGTSFQVQTTSVAFASTEKPGAALLAFAVGRRFLTEARDRWLSSS